MVDFCRPGHIFVPVLPIVCFGICSCEPSRLGIIQVCCDVYVGFEDEDSRSYELAASSENEMQRWIQAIRNARCVL